MKKIAENIEIYGKADDWMKKIICFCMVLALAFGMDAKVYAQEERGIELSWEEQKYVEQKKDVKVAVLDNFLPISFVDERAKSYKGLAVDILNRFAEDTGLTISYIEADNYQEAAEMVEEGTADIAATIVEYAVGESAYNLEISEPYLSAQMMILHNKNVNLSELKEYEVAEIRGYPKFTDNPAISHQAFDSLDDCMQAIRSSQADILYCDIFTGMSRVRRYENRDLISFPINTETQFRFGITQEADPLLKTLLDRTIAQMSRKEINDSLTHNQGRYAYNFNEFVYYYVFEIIGIMLVAAFLVLLFVITLTRIRSRQSIELHGYAKSYCMLADTFGEAGLNYDYLEDKMTVFGEYASKLSMPPEIENFSAYLENEEKEISLTREQFEKMLEDGMEGKTFDVELQCKLSSGAWHHFRLMFSVISTDEAYQRPVCMVGCLIDMEEEHEEKAKLLQMGMYDKLTGLFNRAGAEMEMKRYLQEKESIGRDLLLIIDVDFFKKFNDIYGHKCGDDVLVHMAHQLNTIFRKGDILCRWGGDEFLLYLVGAAERTEAVKERCAELEKTMKKYQFEGKEIPVTLSIGGAVVEDASLETTFKAADKALYSVKEAGRDSVCIP